MGERIGIENVHGNCVLNSLVQALYTSQRFREKVLNFKYEKSHLKNHLHGSCPLCCLKVIFQQLERRNRKVVITTEYFRESLERMYGGLFKKGAGLNCTKALPFIFKGLHKSTTGIYEGDCSSSGCKDPACPVHCLLTVQFDSRRRCNKCNSNAVVSRSASHVNVLGPHIKKLKENRSIFTNLLDCVPGGGNCSYCDSKTIYYAVLRTSELFIISVYFDEKATAEERGNTLQEIPALLHLTGAYGMVCQQATDYSLIAMCCGNIGHLMCFASSNGIWARYNDESVVRMGSLKNVIRYCKEYNFCDLLEPVYLFYEVR